MWNSYRELTGEEQARVIAGEWNGDPIPTGRFVATIQLLLSRLAAAEGRADFNETRALEAEQRLKDREDRRCRSCHYWRDEVCTHDGILCAEFTPPGFGCTDWRESE